MAKNYPIAVIRNGLKESIRKREEALLYDIGSLVIASNLGNRLLAEKACATLHASIFNIVPLYMHASLIGDTSLEKQMYVYRTAALLPNARFPSRGAVPVTLDGIEQLMIIPYEPIVTSKWQQLYELAKEHLAEDPTALARKEKEFHFFEKGRRG